MRAIVHKQCCGRVWDDPEDLTASRQRCHLPYRTAARRSASQTNPMHHEQVLVPVVFDDVAQAQKYMLQSDETAPCGLTATLRRMHDDASV